MSGESLVFTASRQPPPKPPDDSGKGYVEAATPLSFRDKIMGNKKAPPPKQTMDLVQQGLVKVDYVDGNRLLPRLHIDEKIFEELCDPWKEALVIKLLDKTVGFKIMKNKLTSIWKLVGGFDLMDVDNGFYMVKFDLPEDREKVIAGGPWMVFDHYLVVSSWSPDFVSSTTKIEKTMVWVRFPGMNLVYYDESILLAMAYVIGKPIKVDQRTLSVDRGRFARVCVEIDLNQPVVAQIWVRGTWHKVAYEGLHILCSACGCYGHLTRNCTVLPAKKCGAGTSVDKSSSNGIGNHLPQDQEIHVNHANNISVQSPSEVHGEWIIVIKKKPQNKGGAHKKDYHIKSHHYGKGNQFIPLINDSHVNSQDDIRREISSNLTDKLVIEEIKNLQKFGKERDHTLLMMQQK